MKAMNEVCFDMLDTIIDTSDKQNKQEEKITDLSYKLSAFKDRLGIMITNET